jgi:hypothetical protein
MTADQLPGVPHQTPLPQDPLLTLAGLSRDGKRLLLVSSWGAEFMLPIDSRLTAALRGDSARLGQLEITMDSTLRPRDIQARIRAGETVDAVAEAGQTTIDKIMPYAAPVLAEREHITQRAQRSSLRRPGSAARTLGDAIDVHLRALNVDPDVVAWDAWRREDGRWTLTAVFDVPGRAGTATFTFDAPGNFTTLEDELAQWLVGEAPAPVPAPSPAAPARLSAVQAEPAVVPAADREPTIDLSEAAAAVRDGDQPPVADPAADEPQARRPTRKKSARASVPTWDEIMFGGGKSE